MAKQAHRQLLFRVPIALMLSASIVTVTPSHAAPLRGYLVEEKTVPNWGGAFTSVFGQEDLDNAPGGSNSFINKEMWIVFNSIPSLCNNSTGTGCDRDYWIEVGSTRGPTSDSLNLIDPALSDKKQWRGSFLAMKYFDSSRNRAVYKETSFGTANATGQQKFSISHIGSNQWVVYANNARVLTIPWAYSQADYMQLGIETTDDSNTFLNSTFATNIQGKLTNGQWQGWSSSGSQYLRPSNLSASSPMRTWKTQFTLLSDGNNILRFLR